VESDALHRRLQRWHGRCGRLGHGGRGHRRRWRWFDPAAVLVLRSVRTQVPARAYECCSERSPVALSRRHRPARPHRRRQRPRLRRHHRLDRHRCMAGRAASHQP
jgi:hypothetical protein